MKRDEFFSKALKLVVGKGIEFASDNPMVKSLESLATPWERPPGAISEREFKSACTGCDECMIACPVNVIMVEDTESRLPVIYPQQDPCIHCEDTPCITACTTGALFHPGE